jgi:predicted aldo/keto reductase-like oxidoreductase
LNDEEMEVIKQVVDIINNNIAVDCTKCNYCLDYCPTDINIPKLFEFYNSDNIIGIEDWTPVGNAYINYARTGHPIASDCIECEACVNECPQHLPIPDLLQDVAKHFETPNNGF